MNKNENKGKSTSIETLLNLLTKGGCIADTEIADKTARERQQKKQRNSYHNSVMLTRPLIYTAITRGKDNVIIVGERRALCIAIKRTDTERRGTCLAKRLKEIQNQT